VSGKTVIVVTEPLDQDGLAILHNEKSFETHYVPGLKPQELQPYLSKANALIIRTATIVSETFLDLAPNLKVICRAGIGMDHIDLHAAEKRGIVVMNTPAGNRVSTAEHAVALILSCARQIPQATAALRSGRWDREEFTGLEISGKTLGIIGLGNIGRLVAKRAQALEMKTIAYDPYINADSVSGLGVKLVPMDELLENSDFVSFHVPLTPETKGMANSNFFARMKKGAYLINTSRGKVIVEDALIGAIGSGLLSGCALDVFETEPLPAASRLKESFRVILTPHVAGQTRESIARVSLDSACQVRDFFLKGLAAHVVKPA
jgi:D-3-phosphoglycerate dehydrogenase / 2-oxoglutarate reductase